MDQFIIYKAADADFLEIEKLQERIWGFSSSDIVRTNFFVDIVSNGGIVLVAKNIRSSIIGFVVGFVGIGEDGHIFHCSDMLGVLPEYRSLGVGYSLKIEQRKMVQAQGINLIKWTYDPLESQNAKLNIAKLGGTSRTYYRNFWGSNLGLLNFGIETDRIVIEWWIQSSHVNDRLTKSDKRPLLAQLLTDDVGVVNQTKKQKNLLNIRGFDVTLTHPKLLVEIPDNFQQIKTQDINLAIEWRMCLRFILESYFEKKYIISDFLSTLTDIGERKNFYWLSSELPSKSG